MGFFGSLIGGAVKVALTPVAVVVDVANVVSGQDVTATTDLLDSAMDDLEDAVNSIGA